MGLFESDGKVILLVFVGIIIAAVFMSPIGDQVVNHTQTRTLTNETIARPAVNTTTDLAGRTLVGTALVSNNTGDIVGAVVSTGTSSTTGLQSVQIFLNDTAFAEAPANINVTYTFEPDGYIQSVGGRGITTLILIMAALAMVVFTVTQFIDKGSLGKLMGRR